jgi:hypothetical protein
LKEGKNTNILAALKSVPHVAKHIPESVTFVAPEISNVETMKLRNRVKPIVREVRESVECPVIVLEQHVDIAPELSLDELVNGMAVVTRSVSAADHNTKIRSVFAESREREIIPMEAPLPLPLPLRLAPVQFKLQLPVTEGFSTDTSTGVVYEDKIPVVLEPERNPFSDWNA